MIAVSPPLPNAGRNRPRLHLLRKADRDQCRFNARSILGGDGFTGSVSYEIYCKALPGVENNVSLPV
jgi:hypothetical protein